MDWVKFIFIVLLSSLYLYSAFTGDRWNMGSGLKWGERKGPKGVKNRNVKDTLDPRSCKHLEIHDNKLYCNLWHEWLPDWTYCSDDISSDCEDHKDHEDYEKAQKEQRVE